MTGYGAAHPYQVRMRAAERARTVEMVIANDGTRGAITRVALGEGVAEGTIRRWLRDDPRTVYLRRRPWTAHRQSKWVWREGVTPP